MDIFCLACHPSEKQVDGKGGEKGIDHLPYSIWNAGTMNFSQCLFYNVVLAYCSKHKYKQQLFKLSEVKATERQRHTYRTKCSIQTLRALFPSNSALLSMETTSIPSTTTVEIVMQIT